MKANQAANGAVTAGGSAPLFVAQEMQDGEIELVRVLQKREVACVRQDQKPSMRDGRGDIPVCGRLIASSWSPSTTRTGVSIAFS